MSKKTLRLIGLTLVLTGALIIILTRIYTINLTEGQALIEHWPAWSLAVMYLLIGAHLVKIGSKK